MSKSLDMNEKQVLAYNQIFESWFKNASMGTRLQGCNKSLAWLEDRISKLDNDEQLLIEVNQDFINQRGSNQ